MKTTIRVIAPGIYGANGMVEVGTEFEISGAIPEGWKTRVQEVSVRSGEVIGAKFTFTREDGEPGTEADIADMDRETLEALAGQAGVKIDRRMGDDKLRADLVAAIFGKVG